MQCCRRRRMARAELKKLKVEARSISHFKEVSFKLENKLVDLTRQLQQREQEKAALAEKISSHEQQARVWREKFEKSEQKGKEVADNLVARANGLIKDLDTLKVERNEL